MHRVYQIFEVLPNGSPQKITAVFGLNSAKARLQELANHTASECFAEDARTRQIVAMMNVPPSKWRAVRHVFQISYDEQLGARRAEVLKSRGYSVMSVIGNEAAKVALTPVQPYDFFIIGDAAPEDIRQEMELGLKAKYPKIKILALNPPDREVLRADYNVRETGSESWLPILSKEFANPGGNPGPNKASTSGA